jgi:hypothetical protein
MQKIKFLLLVFVFSVSTVQLLNAQATFPVNDVANPKDGCYAFTHATIVKDAQNVLQNATLVIRKGKIETVGTDLAIPKDAVIIDCSGKYIYPAFIDIYSDYGIPVQERQQTTGGAGGFFRVQQLTSRGLMAGTRLLKVKRKRIKFSVLMTLKQKPSVISDLVRY